VALHHAVGLEAREHEGVDELVERHAVLQAERDRDREAVHQAAEGGALLVHVEEDLAERAVFVLAGAQVDLVATDDGLLRVAGAAVGQAAALGDVAVHDALGDARGHRGRFRAWSPAAVPPRCSGRRPRPFVLSGWLSLLPSR
jgi:hypothetical protein